MLVVRGDIVEWKKGLTTNTGAPVVDDLNSMTAGEKGSILMQDIHLVEKLVHFDRERIPERVVHAKGAGAHGYFEVTHGVTIYTRAKFLSDVGRDPDHATRDLSESITRGDFRGCQAFSDKTVFCHCITLISASLYKAVLGNH